MAARSGSEFLERLSAARVHGPFADELFVFPSTVLRNSPEDKQYSFACAIANDTPGLRYLAREPPDYGRPRQDHPLGSRFEETDAVVIYFFGDPVRMAGAYVASYDREPYKAAVQAFLGRT